MQLIRKKSWNFIKKTERNLENIDEVKLCISKFTNDGDSRDRMMLKSQSRKTQYTVQYWIDGNRVS